MCYDIKSNLHRLLVLILILNIINVATLFYSQEKTSDTISIKILQGDGDKILKEIKYSQLHPLTKKYNLKSSSLTQNSNYNSNSNPNNYTPIRAKYSESFPPNANDYTYYKNITINHTKVSGSTDLQNFPVLISITDTDLRDDCQNDGDDIAFAINDTWVDYEIEYFNGATGELIAWVNVPSLSPSEDTVLSMFYSNSTMSSSANPSGVWDSNFQTVLHMDSDTSTYEEDDSTQYDNDGTKYQTYGPDQTSSGKIGYAKDFDGYNDYIDFPDFTSGQSEVTMEFWLNFDTVTSDTTIYNAYYTSGYLYWQFSFMIQAFHTRDSSTGLTGIRDNSLPYYSVATDTWYYIALRYSVSEGIKSIYENGQLYDSNSTSIDILTVTRTAERLGHADSGDSYFDGLIDEFRVSTGIARSPDWINTTYYCQNDPSNFYKVGSESHTDYESPIIESYGAEDPGNGTGIFWAEVSDKHQILDGSVRILVDNDEYTMSNNGTHWISNISVTFNQEYNYSVINASDIFNNYLVLGTLNQSITFNNDLVEPEVLAADYVYNGDRFYVNVTDSWGEIDTVIVNVTDDQQVNHHAIMRYYADFGVQGLGYCNNTLTSMDNGIIHYNITVNDTNGNTFLSRNYLGLVEDTNDAPIARNLTLNPSPLLSNSTLVLDYEFYDKNTHEEGGTEITWYRDDGSGFFEVFRVDTYYHGEEQVKEIDSYYLYTGDKWYATVRPRDHFDFGDINTSSIVTVGNTPPTVFGEVGITPNNPFTNSSLTFYYTYDDYDGNIEDQDQLIVEWYRVIGGHWSDFDNETSIPAENTTLNDEFYVRIKVHDGTNYSIWYESPHVIIRNTPPTILNIEINPNNPLTNSTLTLNYTYDDYDGNIEDQNQLIVEWRRGGIHWTDFDNETSIPAYNTSINEIYIVQIRVYDGTNYSRWFNSQPVFIKNTPPIVLNVEITPNNPLSNSSLILNYTYDDYDGNIEDQDQLIVEWYRVIGGHWSDFDDETSIPAENTSVNQEYYVRIRVYDGTNYSVWYESPHIIIRNTPPTILNIEINPNNPLTNSTLTLNYTYDDYDGNIEDQDQLIVEWYRVIGGHWSDFDNETFIPAENITKGQEFYVRVRVFDGTNYSVWFNSSTTLILNSIPEVTLLDIYPTSNQQEFGINLTWIYSDNDNDPQIFYNITWLQNGIEKTNFSNQFFIAIDNPNKAGTWRAELQVYDGSHYSTIYIVQIVVDNFNVFYVFQDDQVNPHTRVDEFFIEDENVSIKYYFSDEGDAVGSRVQWFKFINNVWIEIKDFENDTSIHYSNTSVGDQYFAQITPFDGSFIWYKLNTTIITIESRPKIHTSPNDIVQSINDTEGHYSFVILTNDTRNQINTVEYTFDNRINDVVYAQKNSEGLWILALQLSPTDFQQYMNSSINVQVKITTIVQYDSKSFEIFTTMNFTIKIEDIVAPQVLNAYFEKNTDRNPTELIFYAEIQEFGSGIDQVILYYYFQSIQNGGTGASYLQSNNWIEVPMSLILHNTSNNFYLYSVTIPASQNNTDYEVIYRIHTVDNNGNTDPEAFNILNFPQLIKDQRIIFFSNTIPTELFIIMGVIICIIFVGSIVYVRYVRKPELVGLDKDLVMKTVSEIPKSIIDINLESHTLGVVVSFFDQRHGPIPIIVAPEILKDNYSKLIELSDRSFNVTGFSDDFKIEITSSYDFVISQKFRMGVLSYGFALEKPEARGGKENLTCNILITKEIFPLVKQFQEEIQQQVHKVHLFMIKEPDNKEQIKKQFSDLRQSVSSIILSYEKIYGTTELLD